MTLAHSSPAETDEVDHTLGSGEIPRPLAILIVAYRAPEKLEKCLASALKFLPNAPIHVWDNSGPCFDGVREMAKSFPSVHWHVGGENLGYAGAVNRLAATVPAHDFLLINPDAELLSGLVSTRAAIEDSDVAVASPMCFQNNADENLRRTSLCDRRELPWDLAYRKMTLVNTFGHAAGLSKLLRGSCVSQLYRAKPSVVDGFISGPCIIVSRRAWDRIGPFDEEFFLYQEEVEWQRRAWTTGWRLRLTEEIGFRHSGQGTVADDPARLTRSGDLAFANAVLMVEYCFGRRTAEWYLAFSVTFDELKRRLLHRPRPSKRSYDVAMTANGDAESMRARVATALDLANCGHSVCVVSMQRLGILQRELPPTIRLIRRPWWWPFISPQTRPSLLLTGSTREERRFGRLFKISHPRTSLLEADPRASAQRTT